MDLMFADITTHKHGDIEAIMKSVQGFFEVLVIVISRDSASGTGFSACGQIVRSFHTLVASLA